MINVIDSNVELLKRNKSEATAKLNSYREEENFINKGFKKALQI